MGATRAPLASPVRIPNKGAGQEKLPVRVALLSLLETTGEGPGAPRGYLRIGGQSVARHQLGLALALGCSRIVFLAETLSGELVALQHVAEDSGAQFHVVSAPRALIGLIAPEDDLIVLGDGLLAMPEEALALLNDAPGVLVLPVEQGLAAGFERIDINHSEAGAMRLPGRLVARLGDLPGDWSAPSALLRLAMQGGVRQIPLLPVLVESGRWSRIANEEQAHAVEPRWLRLHTATGHRRNVGEGLAALLVHWLGPAVLHAGTRPVMIAVGALVLALLGIGSAWLGSATLGFLFFGTAWLVRKAAALLERIERDSLALPAGWFRPEEVFAWSLDLGFLFVMAWRSRIPAVEGVPRGMAWFAPVVLVGLLHLLPRALPGAGWTHWLTDRFLLGIGLAFASAFTPFDPVLMATGALLLVAGVFFPGSVRVAAPNPVLTKEG